MSIFIDGLFDESDAVNTLYLIASKLGEQTPIGGVYLDLCNNLSILLLGTE